MKKSSKPIDKDHEQDRLRHMMQLGKSTLVRPAIISIGENNNHTTSSTPLKSGSHGNSYDDTAAGSSNNNGNGRSVSRQAGRGRGNFGRSTTMR